MRELRPWLRLILRRPGRLVVGGSLILGTLLSGIALLAVSGWFITETARVGLLLAAGIAATINIYVPGGAIRFFAVSRTAFRYLERLYNHDTVLRLITDIRLALFQKLALASPDQRRRFSGAQWLSRLTRDVDALDTLYLRLIAPAALAALVMGLMVLFAAMLFSLSIALWIGLLLFLALMVATVGAFVSTWRLSRAQSDQQETLRTFVIEHIEGFAELTAAGRNGKHAARLMRQARKMTTEQAVIDTRIGWHLAGANLLVHLGGVFALWAGFALFEAGSISGPVLVLLPLALLGVVELYSMLPEAFGKLGATVASAARLNRSGQASAPAAGEDLTPPPPGIALLARDLTIRHAPSPPLFTHFNLEVRVGEHLGITGYSGSGKSSLADTFAGLLPANGELRRQSCAYLTQTTVLFEDTLRANLLLARPKATDGELWALLEQMELAERFAREPDQLDTWLGNAGSRVSGGEARRLVLARVLLSPAPLIILDEPFTGLDAQTRHRVSEQMARILDGKTIITLAHGADALPGTDRVIRLDA